MAVGELHQPELTFSEIDVADTLIKLTQVVTNKHESILRASLHGYICVWRWHSQQSNTFDEPESVYDGVSIGVSIHNWNNF